MKAKILNKETDKIKVEITIDNDDILEQRKRIYQKEKGKYSAPGFRKGKLPFNLFEKYYGEDSFFEEAIGEALEKAYSDATIENNIFAIDSPKEVKEEGEPKKDGPHVFTFEVKTIPAYDVKDYNGVEIEEFKTDVTEEEIDKEIDSVRERNSKLEDVDRVSKDGDTVVINFLGKVDDVAFEGGKGDNYPLQLGSNTFIPGFEEQLISKKKGDDVLVKVKFPEDYMSEQLKGKDAVFETHIIKVQEKKMDEVNDEFAKDVSEFNTLKEYKDDIKNKIKTQKEEHKENAEKDSLLLKVVESNAGKDVPETMIAYEQEKMFNEFMRMLSAQGIDGDAYFKSFGKTKEEYKETLKDEAKKRTELNIILYSISVKEEIEVTDEDLEAEYKKMSEQYKMELKDIKRRMTNDLVIDFKLSILYRKVVDFLYESAVVKNEK